MVSNMEIYSPLLIPNGGYKLVLSIFSGCTLSSKVRDGSPKETWTRLEEGTVAVGVGTSIKK